MHFLFYKLNAYTNKNMDEAFTPFFVILQEGIFSAADNGRKWHVAVVIGKMPELWMILSAGV
jgi:hypothetical protein